MFIPDSKFLIRQDCHGLLQTANFVSVRVPQDLRHRASQGTDRTTVDEFFSSAGNFILKVRALAEFPARLISAFCEHKFNCDFLQSLNAILER